MMSEFEFQLQNTETGEHPIKGGKRKAESSMGYADDDETTENDQLIALAEKANKEEGDVDTGNQHWETFHNERIDLAEAIKKAIDVDNHTYDYEKALLYFQEARPKEILEQIRSNLDPASATGTTRVGDDGGDNSSMSTEEEALTSEIARLNMKIIQFRLASDLYDIAKASYWQQHNIVSLLKYLRTLTQAENQVDTEAAERDFTKRQKTMRDLIRTRATENLPTPDDNVGKLIKARKLFDTDSHFGHKKIMNSRPNSWRLMLLSEVYNQALARATFLERCDAKTSKANKTNRASKGGKIRRNLGKLIQSVTGNRNHKPPSTTTSDQDLPEAASELQPNNLDEYKEHIGETISFLNEIFDTCYKGLQPSKAGSTTEEQSPAERQSIQPEYDQIMKKVNHEMNQEMSQSRERKLYFPGPRVQEVEGVQPIFEWLLGKVAFSLSQEDGPIHHRVTDTSSKNSKTTKSTMASTPPQKNTPRKEDISEDNRYGDSTMASPALQDTPRKENIGTEGAMVSNDPGEHIRYGDFTCVKDGRHIWVYRDHYMPFIIAVKPLLRTDKGWRELFDNALQQVLAHTANYVSVGALAGGGVGADSHASGAIGTLTYILIVRLKLQGMEAGAPKLVIDNTQMLPLMTKENFRKYCKANPRSGSKNKYDALEDKLYRDEASSSKILPGFLAMSQIISASSSELFGHPLLSYTDESECILGPVLGFGTFSNVYSILGPNAVAKISRFGREKILQEEANNLRELWNLQKRGEKDNQEEDGSQYVCKFIAWEKKSFNLRGYKRVYNQLVISPVCDKGALEYIQGAESLHESKVRARAVFVQSLGGLGFLHAYGFVHNDLSSKNIMMKDGKVVILDLSLASKIGKPALVGQGNLQTMHRACFGDCGRSIITDDEHKLKVWYPEALHDKVSLAYAIVIMCHGSVPWPMLRAGVTKNLPADFDLRQQKAREVVDIFFEGSENKILKELIGMDECKYYTCGCNLECTRQCSCRKREKTSCSPACDCKCEKRSDNNET